MSLFYAYHPITSPNAHIPAHVLAYKFDHNKAYINVVTYKFMNTSITSSNFHLINHHNNKRYTIEVIQIWLKS
jgi:hypothetical protein